jgi:large subunit ribosomal protein L4
MATVPVYSTAGEKAGEVELAPDVFGIEPSQALMHQAVVTTLANMRQGTADTKTRGEVKHTTRKLWRQKGTGRARQGMRSAPHFKGGGVAFGPHPRDYSLSFPKKMRRKALLSALTVKAQAGGIMVVDALAFDAPKTKQAAALLSVLGLTEKKVLLVLDMPHEHVVLSFRNLPNVYITTADLLGTYDVLNADVLLFSRDGLAALESLKQQPLGIERWMTKQQGGAA